MKISKRKTVVLALFIACVCTTASAQEFQVSPQDVEDLQRLVIQSPSGLDEGTETKLTEEEISDVRPWAENSRINLEVLLDSTANMRPSQKFRTLRDGISGLVLRNTPLRTELLMRYILNRALKIVSIIEEKSDDSVPGVLFQKNRVLTLSVEMALRYVDSDLAYLGYQESVSSGRGADEVVSIPFARFGIEYADFLMYINESLLAVHPQYDIFHFCLGLLQWDLNRDEKRTTLAPVIVRIYNHFRSLPDEAEGVAHRGLVARMREVRLILNRSLAFAVEQLEVQNPFPHRSENRPSPAVASVSEIRAVNAPSFENNPNISLVQAKAEGARIEALKILDQDGSRDAIIAIIFALQDSYSSVSEWAYTLLSERASLTGEFCGYLKLAVVGGHLKAGLMREIIARDDVGSKVCKLELAEILATSNNIQAADFARESIWSRSPSREELAIIEKGLSHTAWERRRDVAQLMGQVGDSFSLDAMMNRLKVETDSDVNEALGTAIRRLRKKL